MTMLRRLACVFRDPRVLASLLACATSPAAALAGPAMDAYERKARAVNEYHQSVDRLGPGATEAQKTELRRRILDPASVAQANAMNSSIGSMERDVRRHAYDGLKRRFLGKAMPDFVKNLLGQNAKGGGVGAGTAGSGAKTTGTIKAPPSRARGEALDGSQVPRVIEFGAPAKER